jgi:hypothetical protein
MCPSVRACLESGVSAQCHKLGEHDFAGSDVNGGLGMLGESEPRQIEGILRPSLRCGCARKWAAANQWPAPSSGPSSDVADEPRGGFPKWPPAGSAEDDRNTCVR